MRWGSGWLASEVSAVGLCPSEGAYRVLAELDMPTRTLFPPGKPERSVNLDVIVDEMRLPKS